MITRDTKVPPEMIDKAQKGDYDSLCQIIYRTAWISNYWGRRWGLELETIEDISQECGIQVWQAFNGYDSKKAGADAWITTIVRNRYTDLFRRRNARPKISEFDINLVPSYQETLERMQRKEAYEAALKTIKELPYIHRELLELREVGEFTYEEIANELGMKEGTVKSRISRAREALAERLRGMGHEYV